jgi:uncharacterized membrane protein
MTMTVVFALVGLLVGGAIAELGGALGGAALGYAIGLHLAFKRRIAGLEDEVARLVAQRHSVPDPPAAPLRPWMRSSAPPVAASEELEPPRFHAPAAPSAPEPMPPEVAETEPVRSTRPPPRPIFEPAATPNTTPLAAYRRVIHAPPEPPVLTWIRNYFTGGNLVVRAGIIVLFFGVAFLLKFAAERHMLPIELRLAGVSLGGVALLVIGWRLRERQRAYGLALEGGGVGLLYLTVFAALRLYDLLPPTLAFALLVAIAALSAFLAVGQNSMALAALGASGGFLAPVLASTGQGNHVVLFTFYALLDAGVVAIAWFKAWRPLNLLAFVFTYAIGTAWGVLKYAPENFSTTEPFVILFFAMFVSVAVLFALRRATDLRDYVDGTLVFGAPVMTMLLQSALVRHRPYAMAFSALALSAVYVALAAGAWRFGRERLRLLAAAFLALGVAFLTLAIPLALDGHWTAASWALEGAAILWIGLRQKRQLAIISGTLLQIGAAFSYAIHHDVAASGVPIVNSACLGALFIALAGFASAYVLRQHEGDDEWTWARTPPVWWTLLWWFVAGIGEVGRSLPVDAFWPAVLAFSTATALACAAFERWRAWVEWRLPALLLLPALIVCALGTIHRGHFLWGAGYLAWPLAWLAWTWLLRLRERWGPTSYDVPMHVTTLWLLVALATIEVFWQVKSLRLGAPGWRFAVTALPATAALQCLRVWRASWPMRARPVAWLGIGAAGLAVGLWAWSLIANTEDAAAWPLPYLPLVNPVELAQALALAAIAGWLLFLHRDAPPAWRPPDVMPATIPALAFAVFALLTTMLLRAIHHYLGVAWDPFALVRSTVVQAALSIFWGVIALAAMVAGTRHAHRIVWFTGAVLLGIVLAKLFLVDLSRTATVARIVSFIGVGVLMLVIGRFSPVPPAIRAAETRG